MSTEWFSYFALPPRSIQGLYPFQPTWRGLRGKQHAVDAVVADVVQDERLRRVRSSLAAGAYPCGGHALDLQPAVVCAPHQQPPQCPQISLVSQ